MSKYFILLVILLPLHLISQSSASVQDGLDAYDNGNYIVAYNDLLPHALKGDKIAQHHVGLLFLNGQGVEKSDAKAKDWFRKAARQDYDLSMEQLGLMSLKENNYGAALFWFDRIVGYQSIILYELPSPLQEKAEKQIREIYKKADLFPPPDSGWLAGEIEIHRERMTPNRAVTIYLVIIARSYFLNSSGQEVNLRIVLNDFNTVKIIDALHGAVGADMEQLRNEIRNKGADVYTFQDYQGYTFQDQKASLYERTIKLKSKPTSNSIIKVFSTLNNEWLEHHLKLLDIGKINRILGGHGTYFME